MTKQELKAKIDKLENGIKSKATPSNLIAPLKAQKAKLEKELQDMEASEKKAVKTKKVSKVAEKIKAAKKSVAKKTPAKAPAKEERKKDNIARDGDRKSLPAGKRISKTGKVYYEMRANRTDKQTSVKPYLADGGKLANGKYKYEKGDEGMFQGDEVRVVKYTTSYGGTYEYDIIDENGKIKTHGAAKAEKFENQFRYFPKMADGGELTEKKLLVLKADDEKGGNVFVSEEVVKVKDLDDAKSKVKEFVSKYNLDDKTFTGGRYFKLVKNSKKTGNVTSSDVKSEELGTIDYKGNFKSSGSKMADGGETDWGADLGGGFSIGNDVYITDSKSLFQGKTGFVSGSVGRDLLVTIMDNGNERSVVVSKKGVEKLDAPEYADGGKIKNQYEGKTAKEVWDNLSKEQRQHFLYDHKQGIEDYRGEEYGELKSKEIIAAYNSDWDKLDKWIKNRFDNHVREGQYAKGGELKTAKLLIIDPSNPLSTQLKKLTGDFLNSADFKDIGSGNFNILTHKHSNKIFIVYPKRIYDSLPEQEKQDDINYLKNVEKIKLDTGSMADGGYVIFEGRDNYNDKPLYKVISKDEDNDYDGEFHDNREDAEKELNELKNKDMNYAKGGITREGNHLMHFEPYFEKEVEVASIDEDSKTIRPSHGYFHPNKIGKKSIAWAKKNGYKFIQDGKEFEDGGYMASGGKVPAHFGSGRNIDVFGYQTQNFDICGTAVKEFESAMEIMQNGKESEKESLARCAKYVDNLFGIEKAVVEGGVAGELNFSHAVSDIMSAAIYNYRAEMSINLFSFVPQHLQEIAIRMAKAEKGGWYGLGGMTAGRWYKDKSGEEFKFIGKNDDTGELIFTDGSKRVTKTLEDFEGGRPKENKLFGFFEDGGSVAEGNYEMLMSNIKAIKHHAEELEGAVTPNTEIESWVLSKSERAETDLSDITHYLDGLKMEKGGTIAPNLLIELWFAVQQGQTDKYNDLAKKLDENGVSWKLQNAVSDDARFVKENSSKKQYDTFEVKERIERISSGYMAKGGDLSSIKKKYEENEDENAHSENVVLLAKHFGTKEDLAKAKEILALHEKEGSLSSENGKKRQELHLKLIDKARAEMGKQGIEFEKGGYMADGGETGKETIRLKSYNAYGKEINSGDVVIDYDLKTIKLPNGKTLNVEKDWEYTYKVYKTKIKAIHGISGLAQFLKEINKQDSPFNPSVTNLFINNLEKEKMAKGGMTRKGGQPFEVEGRKFFYHKDDGNVYDSNHRLYAGSYSSLELAKKSLEKNFENIKTGNFYKDGGYMASGAVIPKGARVNMKIKDWYIKNYPTDELGEEINDTMTFKGFWAATSQGYNPYEVLGVHDSVVRERVEEKLSKMLGKQEMAKGGIYSSDSLYILKVSKDGKEVGEERFRAKNIREAKEMGEDYEEKYKTKFGGDLSFSVKEAMADGGKVKFADKVKAVQESLLKRKKVSPKVQKDYGKTYSKAEAKESAQRIVGSRMAQLKEKMAKKKK